MPDVAPVPGAQPAADPRAESFGAATEPPAAPFPTPAPYATPAAAPVAGLDAPAPVANGEDDVVEVPRRRINPYLVVLAAVGVGLLFGASWLHSQATELTQAYMLSTSTTQSDYFTMQMMIFGVPMVAALGVLALLGVVFCLALRWPPRRG
jgi:hypothetical protein